MAARLGDHLTSVIRPGIRIILVALLAYSVWTVGRAYWQQDEAHRQIAQAYEFVIHNGDVTSHLACFCDCGKREGHGSLDSCFVSRRDAAGRMVSRDPHAETCKICIDVALAAQRMLSEGATLREIRSAVDAEYATAQPLSTDTPQPPDTLHPAHQNR